LGSVEAIKRSVVSNLGVAYLPRFVVEDELANGTLKELETGISDKKITAICSYHKNKWITPAMELFIRLLKENL
jgi:DNA-binding transcriptional LysR family regulator